MRNEIMKFAEAMEVTASEDNDFKDPVGAVWFRDRIDHGYDCWKHVLDTYETNNPDGDLAERGMLVYLATACMMLYHRLKEESK